MLGQCLFLVPVALFAFPRTRNYAVLAHTVFSFLWPCYPVQGVLVITQLKAAPNVQKRGGWEVRVGTTY